MFREVDLILIDISFLSLVCPGPVTGSLATTNTLLRATATSLQMFSDNIFLSTNTFWSKIHILDQVMILPSERSLMDVG